MKSADRCKATYQGDRCKRDRNHESASNDNPHVHLGEFTMWDDKQILFQRAGTHMRKRSRAANRAVREISQLPLDEQNPSIRNAVKEHLDKITKFFGGKN